MPIKLAPQPFTILALLASRAGQVVTREEIQKQIWGDSTYVDFEHGLNQCVKQIRGALNDNADRPLYVETVPRHGYRFLAPVVSKTILAPPPKVVESKSGVLVVPEGLAAASQSAPSTTIVAAGDAGPVAPATATGSTRAPEVAVKREVRSRGTLFKAAVAIALLVVVVAAAAVYWRSRKARALTARDTIVLADFKNSTGEKGLDDILKGALEIQLEQSPFLKLLPDQKVNDTLRMMDHPANEPLTPEIAREICLRTNSKALLGGTIAALGERYEIEVKATNCETGETLASSEAEAESRSKVLKAVRAVGNEMRRKLGETLAS